MSAYVVFGVLHDSALWSDDLSGAPRSDDDRWRIPADLPDHRGRAQLHFGDFVDDVFVISRSAEVELGGSIQGAAKADLPLLSETVPDNPPTRFAASTNLISIGMAWLHDEVYMQHVYALEWEPEIDAWARAYETVAEVSYFVRPELDGSWIKPLADLPSRPARPDSDGRPPR